MLTVVIAQVNTAWNYISSHWKDVTALVSFATVISSFAYTLFGKKGLWVVAAAAYAAFYVRNTWVVIPSSATLIGAVLSLPLCGFLATPLAALPSAAFLICYILKNESDHREVARTLEEKNALLRILMGKIQRKMDRMKQTKRMIKSNNRKLSQVICQQRENLQKLRDKIRDVEKDNLFLKFFNEQALAWAEDQGILSRNLREN